MRRLKHCRASPSDKNLGLLQTYRHSDTYTVIPAKAGIQRLRYEATGKTGYDFDHWIPAFAGMTVKCQQGLMRMLGKIPTRRRVLDLNVAAQHQARFSPLLR